MNGSKLVRTRPLAPYPQAARYTGTGDVNDAANWSVREPPVHTGDINDRIWAPGQRH